ncbi:MAG: hypothetical protein II703_07155, partial [Ruminococcus sp.]|nr:hypothetical protein [Ruminococcus sp.]
EKKVYVLLNKPKDYVTTSDDPQQRKTVMDLVKNACSSKSRYSRTKSLLPVVLPTCLSLSLRR